MMPGATDMVDLDARAPSPLWRVLGTAALGIAILFLSGILAGFAIAHAERGGGGISSPGAAILAGTAVALAGCIWLVVRTWRRRPRGEPLTRKERLNRNILIVSGALGGITALLITASDHDLLTSNLFTDEPLPSSLALGIVIMLGVFMPILSIYWHRRVVDEQEADAYKVGALYGLYVYMIGAPVWWFAWRGGFAPEINGILLYCATISVVGAVWMWRKYR